MQTKDQKTCASSSSRVSPRAAAAGAAHRSKYFTQDPGPVKHPQDARPTALRSPAAAPSATRESGATASSAGHVSQFWTPGRAVCSTARGALPQCRASPGNAVHPRRRCCGCPPRHLSPPDIVVAGHLHLARPCRIMIPYPRKLARRPEMLSRWSVLGYRYIHASRCCTPVASSAREHRLDGHATISTISSFRTRQMCSSSLIRQRGAMHLWMRELRILKTD